MTTVQEIEKAVELLPRRELVDFRSWFQRFNAEEWDRQFEQDVRAGKLDALADEALQDLEGGRCKKL